MRDKRVRRDIEGLLVKVRILLERIYGNRLVDIVLFGSFSRDRAREDSDIDIAVVLKGNVETIKEIGRISSAIYDLELETGELISIYPLSEEEIKDSIWPLYYHIRKEGIKI